MSLTSATQPGRASIAKFSFVYTSSAAGAGRPSAAQIFFFVNIHSPVMLPFFVNIPFTFLMASFICMACFPSPVMLRSGRTG